MDLFVKEVLLGRSHSWVVVKDLLGFFLRHVAVLTNVAGFVTLESLVKSDVKFHVSHR